MRRAIHLARQAEGFTHPNPLVGAVIVKDGTIIAEGFHHKYGSLHAERDALRDAKERGIDVHGAEMFVTLEPCCHFGKQPPCTQAIIESGIKKVYIGSRDPNPLVNGKGVQILREAGVEVVQDFLREECDAINPVFFHFIKTKMPYVILKYAVTADGMTATSAGKSRWITGESARAYVHKMRSECAAVMTGIATVKADDPMLNVRLDDNKVHHQPVRIILDKNAELSLESALAKTAREIPVIDVCSDKPDEAARLRKAALEKAGVKFIECACAKNDHFDFREVLSKIAQENIDSILVESGGRLNASLLFENSNIENSGAPAAGSGGIKNTAPLAAYDAPLVNEVNIFIAPKIFGNSGANVFSPVRGLGISEVSGCVKLSKPHVEFFDDDILLKYKVITEA